MFSGWPGPEVAIVQYIVNQLQFIENLERMENFGDKQSSTALVRKNGKRSQK